MPASAGGHGGGTSAVTGPVPPPAADVVPRSIKSLEGQKIYDIYYWEEAIQEDGDGGKVVVCRKKTEAMTGSDPPREVDGIL
eukprot:symbB.v1.2.012509.t1/scaffold866.1/size156716/4